VAARHLDCATSTAPAFTLAVTPRDDHVQSHRNVPRPSDKNGISEFRRLESSAGCCGHTSNGGQVAIGRRSDRSTAVVGASSRQRDCDPEG